MTDDRDCTIIIPTVGGREEMLHRVIDAFAVQGFEDIVTVQGLSWGAGINRAIEDGVCTGRRWLTCCDDTVPDPGWHVNAFAMFDAGVTPVVRYYGEDGLPNVPGVDDVNHGRDMSWTRFFLLDQQIYDLCGPLLDTTWWADVDYSEKMLKAGRPLRACDGFRFTHLNAPRDWLTPEREQLERGRYEQSHRDQGIEVPR